MVLNETSNIKINSNIFKVKLVEDMHGHKRVVIPREVGICKVNMVGDSSSDKENSGWDDE